MSFLSKWERDLLAALLSRYESGDFNCGADGDEMKSVSCPKNDEFIVSPNCSVCKFKKRFENLKRKVGAF